MFEWKYVFEYALKKSLNHPCVYKQMVISWVFKNMLYGFFFGSKSINLNIHLSTPSSIQQTSLFIVHPNLQDSYYSLTHSRKLFRFLVSLLSCLAFSFCLSTQSNSSLVHQHFSNSIRRSLSRSWVSPENLSHNHSGSPSVRYKVQCQYN